MSFTDVTIRAITAQELCNECGSGGAVRGLLAKGEASKLEDAFAYGAQGADDRDAVGGVDGNYVVVAVGGGDLVGTRDVVGGQESSGADAVGGELTGEVDTVGGRDRGVPDAVGGVDDPDIDTDDDDDDEDEDDDADEEAEDDDSASEREESDLEIMVLSFSDGQIGAR